MPQNPSEILGDPKFQALPLEERRKVMLAVDPHFGGLPAQEQTRVLGISPDFFKQMGQQKTNIGQMPENVAESLPYIGGAIGSIGATLATGGAALPAIAAATLGAGAGSLAESGIKAATGEGAPNTGGGVAEKALEDATFVGAVPEAVPAAMGGALTKFATKIGLPEKLYAGALRPTGKRPAEAIEAGLKNRIVLNKAAGDKTSKLADALHTKVLGIIDQQPKNISPSQWTKSLQTKMDTLRAQFGKAIGEGPELVKQIDDYEKQALMQMGNVQPAGKQLPENMTLSELRERSQSLPAKTMEAHKESTYRVAKSRSKTAYSPANRDPSLSSEQLMEAGRAAKEDLESVYPQIKQLNKDNGNLIELETELQRFFERAAKKGMSGMIRHGGVPALGAAVGGYSDGKEGAEAGFALGIGGEILRSALSDPAVKSRLAIVLKDATTHQSRLGIRLMGKIPANASRAGEYESQKNQ